MKHLPWKETGWAIVFIVLLAFVYAGSYYAMVTQEWHSGIFWEEGWFGSRPEPKYPFCDEVLKTVYGPMYSLDRKVRPGFWVGMGDGTIN
jgi:hypothetical protein